VRDCISTDAGGARPLAGRITMRNRALLTTGLVTMGLIGGLALGASADEKGAVPLPEPVPESAEAKRDRLRGESIERALDWLAEHQLENGSWGKKHTYAVTGLACLAHLAATDEPFEGERAATLTKGLQFLVDQQKDGVLPNQGHTWIHGQGFATLALSEARGRSLLAETKCAIDGAKLTEVVFKAVDAIQRNQSSSGGWWYTQGDLDNHEGSTTVCAVQALVSASNYGLPVEQAVLDKGFEYLKRCQNPDGGFDYKEGPGTVSMKEGTAAGVSTLALMKRFDYTVMLEGVEFLEKIKTEGLSRERFPFYGHFYATMGMRLFGEEMWATERTDPYIAAAHDAVMAWQEKDGSWVERGWMKTSSPEGSAYSTAFAGMLLSVPEGRLSIFRREPPKLPSADESTGAK
jgi:hypothetical protein